MSIQKAIQTTHRASRIVFTLILIFTFVTSAIAFHPVNAATIWYVDDDASYPSDLTMFGRNWANAFPDFLDAFDSANPGDTIYVASGTYYPLSNFTSSRSDSIAFEAGLQIFGGFDPATETSPDQRQFAAPSILSGDPQGTDPDISDNVYHVVTYASNPGTEAEPNILDGFTIEYGNANDTAEGTVNDRGAGMVIDASGVTLRNIIFTNNTATGSGAGLFITNGSTVTLDKVTFQNNSAGNGAGLYVASSTVMVNNSTFIGNAASASGGGAYLDDGAVSLSNTTFSNNSAFQDGGGVYVNAGTSSFASVTFTSNAADGATSGGGPSSSGGGLAANTGTSVSLTGSRFESNTATYSGGAVYALGGGLYTNTAFVSNSADTDGGAIIISGSSPLLADVRFFGNSAGATGGALSLAGAASPKLANVIFEANTADQGGAVYANDTSGSPVISNATFTKNQAGAGTAGLDMKGSAIYAASSSSLKIANSIFWDNDPTTSAEADIITLDVTYSDVQDTYPGTGNINEDPLFLDVQLLETDNLGLPTDSPAVDAGSNAVVLADSNDVDADGNTTEKLPLDITGQPRFADLLNMAGLQNPAVVDMGAYEVQPPEVSVTKEVTSTGPYHEGDTLDFKITVENVDNGHANTARNVVVQDTLPETLQLDLASLVASTGNATIDNNSITVDGFNLAPTEKITITFSAIALDNGNPTITNTASVTALEIPADYAVTGSASPEVLNVAPVVTIDSSTDIQEGQSTTVNAHFDEIGAADGPFTWSYNWGDGSAATTGTMDSPDNLPATTHRYNNSGVYNGVLTVTDKDGGAGTAGFTINVSNVAPTVSLDAFTTPAEGGTVIFGGRFTDPAGQSDTAYTYTWTLNGQVVASGSINTYNNPNTSVPTYTHAFPVGSYTLNLEVKDKDNGVGTTSTSFNVDNIIPVVDLGTERTIDEGSSVNLTANITDPGQPVGETYTTAWDFGDGDTQAAGANTATHTFVDEGATGKYTVEATVTDSNGGTNTGTVDINVNNVNPTVTMGAIPTLVEGQNGSFTATFTDPGIADTFDYEWNWGDNSDIVTGTTAVPGEISANHTYTQNGTYHGTVTVVDNDLGTGTATFTITISNVVPTITNVSIPADIKEGGEVTFSATFTDPAGADDAPFAYTWIWGDEQANTTGEVAAAHYGSVSVKHTYANNGTFPLSLTITDKDGGASTVYTAQVSVANVAPTAAPTGPASGDEGQELQFNGGFTDPGADTHTYLWVFDDGTTSTAQNPTHTFIDNKPADAPYNVVFTVTDQDAASDTQSLQVTIHNVAPTLTVNAPASINEAQQVTFTSNVVDPGANDTFTYEWTIDGTVQTETTSSLTHTFADNGAYVLSLKVTDKDGASDTVTIDPLTVNSVAPTITTNLSLVGFAGLPLNLSATFTDPATTVDAPYSARWSWDDGSEDTVQTGVSYGSALTATHVFPDKGPYHVTLTVTDKDGVFSTTNITVALQKNFLFLPFVSGK